MVQATGKGRVKYQGDQLGMRNERGLGKEIPKGWYFQRQRETTTSNGRQKVDLE